MGILSWFKKDKKKGKGMGAASSTASALETAAVAAAFAEAGEHEHARAVLQQPPIPQKLLVVSQDDHFSNLLINYALDMAKRLDCELIAVNVTDAPRSLPEPERARAIEIFEEMAKKNAEILNEMAARKGVKVNHRVEIGDPERVVERLHANIPGIRCVVAEPEEKVEGYDEEIIPVYCFA